MTATYVRWYYSVDDVPTVLEITDRVELPIDDNGNAIGVGAYAEEGSGWTGQLIVNDPAGDLVMLCWRRIYAVMEAATTRTVIGNWYITDLDVIRMDPFSGAARQWQVSMADENSLLERLILVGSDGNRPAETDIDRVRWLLTTTELSFLNADETFIDTTTPVGMDACDYIGQRPSDVLQDCQQQQAEGWNYFVMYREDLTPHDFTLAYFNFNTSALYPSTLSLTNVASEVDIASGVYPISADTRLSRSGARIASGEYLPYSGGYVYALNTATRTAYGPRDVSAPAINVKTAATATVRANRHVAQMNEPDDEVTTSIVVEEADLNLAMHGMSINLHATHLPDYT